MKLKHTVKKTKEYNMQNEDSLEFQSSTPLAKALFKDIQWGTKCVDLRKG